MSVIRQWSADHDTPWPPGVPLGYPVDETEVVLLDEQGCETREEGEIAIVARTLPIGYWNDPVRTALAFPPCPAGAAFAVIARGISDGSSRTDACSTWEGGIRG